MDDCDSMDQRQGESSERLHYELTVIREVRQMYRKNADPNVTREQLGVLLDWIEAEYRQVALEAWQDEGTPF
jgi:hypothetical protein